MILLLVAIILVTISFIIHKNYSNKCQDIIGDGYAMGTDPKPVVIGNTCDQ